VSSSRRFYLAIAACWVGTVFLLGLEMRDRYHHRPSALRDGLLYWSLATLGWAMVAARPWVEYRMAVRVARELTMSDRERVLEEQLRSLLRSSSFADQVRGYDALTDVVRISMLESGWKSLPGKPTVLTLHPGPEDPLLLIEGVVRVYARDVEGQVRESLYRRVMEAREGQACATT
jgi:hypothetical protein